MFENPIIIYIKVTLGLIGIILSLAHCNEGDRNQQISEFDKRPNFLVIMSDNHSYKHIGVYGNEVVQTPAIDKIARQGVRFTNAFAAPSCTPARGALLAGQDIWRLGPGANLWSTLPDSLPLYTDLLEEAGYRVGHEGKGWGPGDYKAGERNRNPVGYTYDNFETFLDSTGTQAPWSYWLSSTNPHRPFDANAETDNLPPINPKDVDVPPYLPDVPEVRSDIVDYYMEVQQFDQQVASAIEILKKRNQMENTVILVMADNGWQMPRGLANLYDFGTHVPLIISWPKQFPSGRVVTDFVKLNDLAPTILKLAGLAVPGEYTARSLLPILQAKQEGKVTDGRSFVVVGRERHAIAREGGLGYPARAIRTAKYLYIHNITPERWPAGDPPLFGDIDAHMLQYEAPTKEYMMAHKDEPDVKPLYQQAFLKRPEEELFDLEKDPYQMNNVAEAREYQQIKKELKAQLQEYLRQTRDPRVVGGEVNWDSQPYVKKSDWVGKPRKEARRKFGLKAEYPYRRSN